jgi:hypothetical protein
MNLFTPPEPLEAPPLEAPPPEPLEAPPYESLPIELLPEHNRRDYNALATKWPKTLDSEPTMSAPSQETTFPLAEAPSQETTFPLEEKIRKRMEQNKKIRELKSLKRVVKKHYLMITRFNDCTHSEMLEYCKHIKGVQCSYGVPRLVSNFVNPDGIMFVLEMNNDIDKIVGIGMVRNIAIAGKHRIYEEENYNRYAYLGKTRIAREQMTPDEEELMKILDKHCFKGCSHQKRGQGINFFPPNVEIPEYNAVEFIIGMFKRRI